MSNAATKSPTKLETAAMKLFQVKTPGGIRDALWALRLREPCGRCGGSGHYSRNSMGSTKCYDCRGAKERPARLTRSILEAARVKVEAGELEACRRRGAARIAARKAIKVALAAEEEAASYICGAYTAADRVAHRACVEADAWIPIPSELVLARRMSISIRRTAFDASLDVEFHKADPVRALATIEACIAMQRELLAAWRAWQAAQRASFRGAARARLAA